MDFFDDEDAPAEDEPPRRRERSGPGSYAASEEPDGRPSREQIRTRQLTFIGVAIVIFILLVLAVRGCLDARKERAFQNYVSDLSAITAESEQLSDGFFGALQGRDSDVSLDNQVNADRGTAGTLAERAENLDAPDQLAEAQRDVSLAFRLRADAMAAIAERMNTALGEEGARRAQRRIAEQMRVFAASDVLYERGRDVIEQTFADEGIVVEGGVPESEFLPSGRRQPDYLQEETVQSLLAGAGGGGGGGRGADGADCDPGDELTHGLGLISVAAAPSGTALLPDSDNTISAEDTELTATVQNQGDPEADESDITVRLEGDFTGTQTISSLPAGEQSDVTIPLRPSPSAGDSGSITVTVDPVCGEQVLDNNTFSYELTFG